ncbi:MAG: hypothetical protein A2X49_10515 [Lentisphaerae bacterium GWF2_52_8]|nr:MAG: hypothetical protein A2X49_10515 [Lentisphaerae bacterium GWF2_52_8]
MVKPVISNDFTSKNPPGTNLHGDVIKNMPANLHCQPRQFKKNQSGYLKNMNSKISHFTNPAIACFYWP